MKFKHGTRRRALEYEKDWVQRWKADNTFEKSVENRPVSDGYVFYDGPPFITGVPHHGTLLSSIVKDAVPRYWTMKGKRVERRWGWDCHGLPAENFVEKQLNITDRRQIVTNPDDKAPLDKDGNELPTITLEQYITKARESMVANSATWEDVVDRVGRWVDFKGAYRTMNKDFMESVWWAFKELYDKGKIYEGEKVLMYDTRFATPVSKNEVTMDNDAYQTVTDPSVYVKFKLKDFEHSDGANVPTYMLAWTTTPWTLPGNTALAVNKDLDYVEVKVGDEQFILAKELAEKVLVDEKKQPLDYETLREMKGEELVGLSYEPLFEFGDPTKKDNEFIAVLTDKDFTKNAADFDESSSWKREAARAVLENNDGKIALMHSQKWDYYKLPGGGIDDGETRKEALKRELLEEVGAEGEILEEIGTLEELRSFADNQRQLSYAYHAKVVGKIGESALEEGELAEEFVVVWVGLDEAIELAKSGNRVSERGLGMQFMAHRDELILREYKRRIETTSEPQSMSQNAHKVWAADYVSAENGTGIVHLAPIYGEEDFVLAQENEIPRVHVLDDNGYYYPEVAAELYKLMPWVDATKPLEVWENNKNIAKGLEKAGIVWKTEYIRHEYPFNPRSKQRIMYRAIPSWFFDVQGSKPLMLEQNQNINWFPEHLKHGRFEKNIQQAPDWNLSRDRFWATAMPVWKGDKGTVKVVGSYAELKELSGVELDDYHRPWVDDITFEIDGEKFTRIDKVLDCWFESGSMPFAQFHYPFENKEKFEQNFPGDFIVEYVGQVRAWFYYVHVVNTALFGTEAFKNVITTGVVAGNDGRKMSKSLGNFTDPNELMDKFSADSLRFLLLSSPLLNGEDFALQDKDVGDVARKLSMAWNMYDFFTMYAEVDGWEYKLHEITDEKKSSFSEIDIESLTNPLDIWIVSRVHQLVAEVEKHMDVYNLPDAMSPILPFLDDASNWYVRRSRRRFWKSEDDSDKAMAYRTLHYVLVRLAYVLAPFTPFLAEELYHNLTGDSESIHLKDWLPAGRVNELVMNDMDTVRDYVNQGLSLRAKARLKVRQPLASVTVPTLGQHVEFEPILTDELNVKAVKQGEEVAIDETLTPELRREGLMREIIRHVQAARKSAGLNVDDRIQLSLAAHPDDDTMELKRAIEEHAQAIADETLTDEYGDVTDGHETTVKVEGMELRIGLKKAA